MCCDYCRHSKLLFSSSPDSILRLSDYATHCQRIRSSSTSVKSGECISIWFSTSEFSSCVETCCRSRVLKSRNTHIHDCSIPNFFHRHVCVTIVKLFNLIVDGDVMGVLRNHNSYSHMVKSDFEFVTTFFLIGIVSRVIVSSSHTVM